MRSQTDIHGLLTLHCCTCTSGDIALFHNLIDLLSLTLDLTGLPYLNTAAPVRDF